MKISTFNEILHEAGNNQQVSFEQILKESQKEIYQLREQCIELTDMVNPPSYGKRFVNELIEKTNIQDIGKILENIKWKPNWSLICNLDSNSNALDVIEEFEAWGCCGLCYLIISENEPVGIIGFNLHYKRMFMNMDEDPDGIEEIYLLSFKNNNITLVKDVFNLINKLKKQLKLIKWSVKNDNPIKKAYDKMVTRWGGEIIPEGDSTHYLLKN